jgi:hypothetical protein
MYAFFTLAAFIFESLLNESVRPVKLFWFIASSCAAVSSMRPVKRSEAK